MMHEWFGYGTVAFLMRGEITDQNETWICTFDSQPVSRTVIDTSLALDLRNSRFKIRISQDYETQEKIESRFENADEYLADHPEYRDKTIEAITNHMAEYLEYSKAVRVAISRLKTIVGTIMTDRSQRMTGHFGPQSSTFGEEFPDCETLKIDVNLHSHSSVSNPLYPDSWSYGKDSQVPTSDTIGCRTCKHGSFPLGHMIRECIDTRQKSKSAVCCSWVLAVTVEATYKPR